MFSYAALQLQGGYGYLKKLYVCIYLRNLFKAFSEWNRSKNTGISFPDVPVEVMNFEVTIAQTREATIALALYHSLDFAQTNLAKQRQSIYILSIFLAIADHNILLQPTIVFILTTINHILSCIASNPKLAKSWILVKLSHEYYLVINLLEYNIIYTLNGNGLENFILTCTIETVNKIRWNTISSYPGWKWHWEFHLKGKG